MISKITTAFIVLALFAVTTSFGQEIPADSIRKLVAAYKPLLETDTIDLARRKITLLKNGLYKIEDSYPSGKLAARKYSQYIPKTEKFFEVKGSTAFFEGGEISKVVMRLDNATKQQVREHFYSGSVYREYEINYPEGVTIRNVFDTNGNQLVKEGKGESSVEVNFDKNDIHIEFGSYENGRKMEGLL